MSILNYFRSLPKEKDTGIGSFATKEANRAVKRVLSDVNEPTRKKREVYTAFNDQQRAAIGKYAAECGDRGNATNTGSLHWQNREMPPTLQISC